MENCGKVLIYEMHIASCVKVKPCLPRANYGGTELT